MGPSSYWLLVDSSAMWPDEGNGNWQVWGGSAWLTQTATQASMTCNNPFPTGLPTPGPTLSPLRSCHAWRQAGQTTSGIYRINPSGASGGAVHSVYCDQTTDSGGWMLTLAYAHTGGENNALVEATTPPTDPTGGYSHVVLDDLSGFSADYIEETRFYCETSAHSRKVHFKTDNRFQAGAAFSGSLSSNTASYWTSGYTALSGHDAYLPASATSAESDYTTSFCSTGYGVSDGGTRCCPASCGSCGGSGATKAPCCEWKCANAPDSSSNGLEAD